jgi:hypothetical protein
MYILLNFLCTANNKENDVHDFSFTPAAAIYNTVCSINTT